VSTPRPPIGLVGNARRIPLLPPVKLKADASDGMMTASANVASARYTPARRSAGNPNRKPAIPATTPAAGTVSSCGQPWSTDRSAVVYAPMAMNAPWPREIWPVIPVRMLRPNRAIANTATYVNSAIVKVPTKCGSAITAAASAA
jgi:hypothetical protein